MGQKNKTNPKPESGCVVCNDEVKNSQDALECTMCHKWCHRHCPTTKKTNIRDACYLAHCDAEDDQPWFCPVCKPLIPTALAAYKELKAFKVEIADQMAAIQAQITELKQASNPVVARCPPAASIDIQSEIQEALEKEKKKNSLVVVGLPETDKSTTRSEADKNFVLGVCEKVGVKNEDIVDVFRNGELKDTIVDGHPYARIVKIKFSSLSAKLTYMKKFRAFKPDEDEYEKVYVRPDLTYRERAVDKALRDQLFAQRDLNPTADLIIRRGKIVPRDPPQ